MKSWRTGVTFIVLLGCASVMPRVESSGGETCTGSAPTGLACVVPQPPGLPGDWEDTDRRMAVYARTFPDDALPLYWQALRAYQTDDSAKAVGMVGDGVRRSTAEVVSGARAAPDTPQAYVTSHHLRCLVEDQTRYACTLAGDGDADGALAVSALSLQLADQVIGSIRSYNGNFFGAVGVWLAAADGKAKLLRSLGLVESADAAAREMKEMQRFATQDPRLSARVLMPLADDTDKKLAELRLKSGRAGKGSEGRAEAIRRVLHNAQARLNKTWVLLWKHHLASIRPAVGGSATCR